MLLPVSSRCVRVSERVNINNCINTAADLHSAPFYTKPSSHRVAAPVTNWYPEYVLNHFQNSTNSSLVHNLSSSQISQNPPTAFWVILLTNRRRQTDQNITRINLWWGLIIDRHPFNGLFSTTTWVSRHQKGKPFWILMKQEMMGWQWHQLDHMQIICISL